MCSHLPEEISLFQWKASGDSLKIQNHPRRLFRPIAIHSYQKYLNPSDDPVPFRANVLEDAHNTNDYIISNQNPQEIWQIIIHWQWFMLPHCPKTKEMEFNLGMLNLYETHFKALFSVNYPYSVWYNLLHRLKSSR